MLQEIALRCSPLGLLSFSFTCKFFSSFLSLSDNPLFPSWDDIFLEASKEGHLNFIRYWCDKVVTVENNGAERDDPIERPKKIPSSLRPELVSDMAQVAALTGQTEIMEYLFEHHPIEMRSSLLLHSIFGNQAAATRLLLSKGCPVSPLATTLVDIRCEDDHLRLEVKSAFENQTGFLEACAFSKFYLGTKGQKVCVNSDCSITLSYHFFIV